ncbi:MAG TPA: urease accessory protein UreD, partial [Opitutus sp.]|nr:urease accessory protein UreD [Opitutus sp.]
MAEFSGHLRFRAAQREHGRTVLAEQSFRAPFHLSKPYWDVDTRVLLVQVVNPTAGILAGDRLESEIVVETGAALCVTTPSASRVFMMRNGEAEARQRFVVARGGWLEVLPEPLVPHRGSRYRQATAIEIEEGGGLFFVDQLLPGRVAHGETWSWDRLRLELDVRCGG